MPSTDLASLMQVAPYAASGFIGQNVAMDQQSENLRQQELAQLIAQRTQEAQFAAQKQPLTLEQLRLGNQTTAAQLPGIIADSNFKAATNDSKIATEKAKNTRGLTDMVTTHFPDLANVLDSTPGVGRPKAFADWLDQQDLPDRVKQGFLQRYTGVSPDQLPALLRADADRLMKANPEFIKANMERQSREKVANTQANASIQAARINSEGRLEAARLAQESRMQKLTDLSMRAAAENDPVKKQAIWIEGYQQAMENGDQEGAARAYRMAQALEPAAQNARRLNPAAGGVNVGGVTGLETNPVPSNLPPAQTPATNPSHNQAPAGMPKAGDVIKGYRFKGGNPADKANWEKV